MDTMLCRKTAMHGGSVDCRDVSIINNPSYNEGCRNPQTGDIEKDKDITVLEIPGI